MKFIRGNFFEYNDDDHKINHRKKRVNYQKFDMAIQFVMKVTN